MSNSGDANTTQRVRTARTLPPKSRGACMVVIHGARLGQTIDLHEVPVVIGRSPTSDFQIEHKSVSRTHCKVWHDSGVFYVRDLGSTNKTYVNQRAVDQVELQDGDHIAVGETVFKFVRRGSLEARYHEALYNLATIDSLTQLYNRRKFREFLEQAVLKAQAEDLPLALMFVDLDHFKRVNDELGHLAGDEVLRQITATLRDSLRPEDVAGRLGGEEFAVLLPQLDLAAAVARAETLRARIEAQPCDVEGRRLPITSSFGVAELNEGMPTASDLMREADAQLFRAKAAGRNRVCAPGH